MQYNQEQERSSNNFNYGAYHSLEAVSVSEQVKIKVIALLGFVTPFLTSRRDSSSEWHPFTVGLKCVHLDSFLILGLFNAHQHLRA